jgi:hypothetical protein
MSTFNEETCLDKQALHYYAFYSKSVCHCLPFCFVGPRHRSGIGLNPIILLLRSPCKILERKIKEPDQFTMCNTPINRQEGNRKHIDWKALTTGALKISKMVW